MLSSLLKFDPNKRITAKQALMNPMFDNVRDPELEQNSTFKVKVDIENPGMFDYEEYKHHGLNVEQMQQLLRVEISQY